MKANKNTGQVLLELSTALIAVFIFILASVMICTWLAGQLAYRQEKYEDLRTSNDWDADLDEGYPSLNIFGNAN